MTAMRTEPTMLSDFPIHATVAAVDLDRARRWYEEVLGVTPGPVTPDGVWYRFAGDTWLLCYQTSAAGTARNTVAGWTVTDLPAVMADLRARGVVFEDYDFGEMRTVDGVLEFGGARAAWFTDSEGNIFELSEVVDRP
jgi:catechol 2,3-dioxygenase-like lactoylglutathione lyase family enzyme